MTSMSAKKIYVDLETTGVNAAKDRVIQIAIINDDGEEWTALLNPEMPIPAESTAIHGITDEMVKDAPVFSENADEIIALLEDADHFVAYNSLFDFQFLQAELFRANQYHLDEKNYTFIDPFKIFQKNYPHNLANAYKHYTGEILHDAHDALIDIRATQVILEKQEKAHPDFFAGGYAEVEQNTLGDTSLLGRWFETKPGGIYFRQGKYKGKKLSMEYQDYLQWISKLPDITISERRFLDEYLD